MRVAVIGVLALCVGTGVLRAQTALAFGELRGTVVDPAEARVPAALLTARNAQTGYARQAFSADDGGYSFPLLPPGVYDVTVQKDAFRSKTIRGVEVTVGQAAILNVDLELGNRSDSIEVSGAPLVVDPERTQQANTMNHNAVENLPIDRRDYLTFTLLAPGIADSNALADNADFRAPQATTSGLSFYGSNGRGNSITVDGGEANNSSGGVRGTLSQEAVQEFQINRGNYSAEFGMSSGGAINIVSKSGTNAANGSLFGFVRNEAFDARNPFANVLQDGRLTGVKPPARRQQFGASAGFPIAKDKTFLFAAFEGLRRDESSVVSVLTDPSIFQPTPAQNAILGNLPAGAAAALRSALTSPQSTMDLFAANSGIFPFPTRDWKTSLRLDHQTAQGDQFAFRYSFDKLDDANANVRALVGATRGTRSQTMDSTANAHWTKPFRGRVVNEAAIQWNYNTLDVGSIEKYGPQLDILGFGFFNRDIGLPSSSIARRWEFREAVTYSRSRHIVKAGGEVLVRGLTTRSDTFFGGRFTFGPLPGAVVSPALASTSITALQAFNLGLAQTYQQGFGDPVVRSTLPYYAAFVQDTWKVAPNLTVDIGIRYELDVRLSPLPLDKNNVAPRFGIAWDPFHDHKTVIRAGYGIYYSPIYFQIDYVVNALGMIDGRRPIAQVFSTIQTPGPAAANNIFSTLRRQGVIGVPTPVRSITGDDLAQFGIAVQHTGPIPPFSVLFGVSPDYVNPYSQQSSLGIERAMTPDLSVSASYIFVRTLKIPRARDTNLLPAPVDPLLGIRVWSGPYFADPTLAQFDIYESTARAFYSGLVLELRKRFGRGWWLGANYTFSKATDEVVDFNSDFQANDQTNLRAERALSSFDQRHKVVVYGLWRAPAGLEVSAAIRANSGRPFNLLAGADLNQDRHSTTDRPVFAGRNTGIGPAFATADMRIGRVFRVRESVTLESMVEGFNLLNRLNYASINNTVGNIPGPFNLHGVAGRGPSQPLGFSSAFEARRLQLGVRLRY